MIFLATGVDNSGPNATARRFYVVFDPDVWATAQSSATWNALIEREDIKINELKKDLPYAALYKIMRAMILGEKPDKFGPLIRKYYPDTKSAMKGINRNLVWEK